MREPDPLLAASVLPLETGSQVAAAARLLASVPVPLPGQGRTSQRFERFAEIAAVSLPLARIAEGHFDATATLAEAGARVHDGLYGVWAADAPGSSVTAVRDGDGWRLRGRKRFCSGAGHLDRALVTAFADDAGLIFDVELGDVEPVPDTWNAVGMAATDSLDVIFDVRCGEPLGAPGFYLDRAGFWQGAVGVAACWYGGALGAMRMLRERCTAAMTDHQAAHLGAVVAECELMWCVLERAAREIDESPHARGQWRALVARQVVERGCHEVLERVGRAGGTSPLVFDRAHAHRAADLVVYLRQHHAERDLAGLGRLAVHA